MARYSAAHEVLRLSEAEVERETAKKWAARALACYAKNRAAGGTRWLLRAESYRHEALEHAALAEDGGKLVRELERRIDKVRSRRAR